jgi:hypothetical protein
MRRFGAFLAVLAAVVGIAAAPAASQSSMPAKKPQVCGIQPGDGAYSFVRAWNIGCNRANKVASKAIQRFCDETPGICEGIAPDGDYAFGRTFFNGWDCKVKLAYEFARVVCVKPGKRFVQEFGA